MKKKLLITGGLGYIGSHAVVCFQMAGYDIVVVDNLMNSSLAIIEDIEKITGFSPKFYEVDIRNKNKLKRVFDENTFDGVIHFAGLKAVGESCENPLLYYDNNIVGSICLFEMMEAYGIKNIIFSSSATVYSSKNSLPWKEDGFLAPPSPYGHTKQVIEIFLQGLSENKKWNVINLRYFNPIGAHSSGLIGENPKGIPNNLLPYIMDVALGKRDKILVYGGDYSTEDGTGKRDYIHIEDLVNGHLKAWNYIEEHASGIFENINLGLGLSTSVLQMIKMSEDIVGKKLSYEIVERRKGDLAEFYCNSTKAKELLGWEPKQGVREAIESAWTFIVKSRYKFLILRDGIGEEKSLLNKKD